MRYRGICAAAVLLAVFAAGNGAAAVRKATTEKAVKAPGARIVRLDLLAAPDASAGWVIRDPFRPKSASVPLASGPRSSGRRELRPPAVASGPVFKMDFAYVGFVRGAAGLVALIASGDATYSAALGEEIVPGYKLVGLTETGIEIEGPGQVRKTFARQGDRS